MTHIVDYRTKKAFREACRKNPSHVYARDTSIVSPRSGSVMFIAQIQGPVTVTNNNRSWVAEVRSCYRRGVVVT